MSRPARSMYDCPKYEKCEAPICPLDADWRERTHLQEDRICFFLSESVKEGAETRLEPDIYEACHELLSYSDDLTYPLKKAIERSSQCQSRIELGRQRMEKMQGR